MIVVNIDNLEINYELIKDNDGFNYDEFIEYYTPYFKNFDYIVGDISYSKLRLKGFYNSNNKHVKEHNNIDNLDKYFKEFCSYKCKYFVLKKISKNVLSK